MQRRERLLGILVGSVLAGWVALQQAAAQPRGLAGEPREEELVRPGFDDASSTGEIFEDFLDPDFAGPDAGPLGGAGQGLGIKDTITGVPDGAGQLAAPNLPRPLPSAPDRIPVTAAAGATSCSLALLSYYDIQNRDVLYPQDRLDAEAMFNSCYAARQPAPQRLSEYLDRSVVIFHASSEHAGGHCTGFLLDADTVVTAAHCFDMRRLQASPEILMTESCPQFSVRLGRDLLAAGNTAEQLSSAVGAIPSIPIASLRLVDDPAQVERCGTLRVTRSDLGRDIVLAKLQRPATLGGAPIAPIEIGIGDDAIAPGAGLFIIGRRPFTFAASGYALVALRENTCRLLFDPSEENGVVIHHCLTVRGMSGGPIFAELSDGSLRMIGVHQATLALSPNQQACFAPFRGAATIPRCVNEPLSLSFMNAGHIVNLLKGGAP